MRTDRFAVKEEGCQEGRWFGRKARRRDEISKTPISVSLFVRNCAALTKSSLPAVAHLTQSSLPKALLRSTARRFEPA
jgi:hypothetical protein